MGTPQTMWVDESERWAPLWVDADSKKSQICVVQMAKNPGTLFLSYTLSTQGVPISRCNFSGTGGTLLASEKAMAYQLCLN